MHSKLSPCAGCKGIALGHEIVLAPPSYDHPAQGWQNVLPHWTGESSDGVLLKQLNKYKQGIPRGCSEKT